MASSFLILPHRPAFLQSVISRTLGLLSILSLAALGAISIPTAHSQVEIYEGSSKLPDHWWTTEWGGAKMVIEPLIGKYGRASLALIVTPEAEPFSGADFKTDPDSGAEIPLGASAMKDMSLVFSITGGISPQGEREDGQQLQVGIELIDATGDVFKPRTEDDSAYLPIKEFMGGQSIGIADDDNWQEVRIPLSNFVIKEGTESISLTGLSFQFTGPAPTSGVYITDIRIE
jgi:hypothetical protein